MVWAGSDRNMNAGVWSHLACLVIGMGLRGEWVPGVVCVPRLDECASWSVGFEYV